LNKKRSPLYDTKTYTLENKDIPQGLFFALISLGLAIYSIQNESVVWATVTSLFVYLAVLLSSNRTRLLVPVVLCLPILIQLPGSTALFRVIIFASIIGITPRKRESVIPLVLLLALWATYLNIAQISALMGREFYTVKAHDIKLGLSEVTGFLILLMLLWSRQFPALFGRLPREVELATVSFVLFLLSTLVGAAVAFVGALTLMGIDFENLISSSHKNSAVLMTLTATLVAIPFTLSIALNRLLKDFGRRVEHILSPNSVLGPVQLYPKIVEFNQIFSKAKELTDSQERKAREIELDTKNTLAQKEEKEKEHHQRVNDSDNLNTIFSLCPTGVMAVSGSGAILAVTPALVNQFRLNNLEKFIGRYYLELQATEEASAEDRRRTAVFLQYVSRLLSDQKNLARSQALRSFLKIDEQTYSEMTVYVFDDRIVPVDWKRISPQLPLSNLTFVIFSNAKEDYRNFILSQFNPRALEIVGGQSIETLKEISALATSLEASVSSTNKSLDSGVAMQYGDLESHLRSLLRTSADFGLEVRAIVTDQLKKGGSPLAISTAEEKTALKAHFKNYNLTEELPTLLRLFEDLAGIDTEILLSVPEGANSEGQPIKQAVKISAMEPQFTELKAIFLALLAGISRRIDGNTLTLTVGTEQIGMTTAALFRGSSPGRYARLVLSHPGQSITSNMMPDSLLHLPSYVGKSDELEVVLGIFSLQIERMKGFLSIQSSPAKGTHVTIYLPEDPTTTRSPTPAQLRKIPADKVQEVIPEELTQERDNVVAVTSVQRQTDSPSILIIEDNQNIRDELSSSLKSFPNLTLTFISRAEAAKHLQGSSQSGAGFDSTSEIDQLFGPDSLPEFNSFTLIILTIFDDLSGGMKLLKKIDGLTNVAVIAAEDDYADALSALYKVISYPVKVDEMAELLEGL
jgi:hypothetical protein